ncbi:MAG: OmpA family protein [Chromatiales bacterium]|nr:OmpA family protein [Chromatiales bacterium]
MSQRLLSVVQLLPVSPLRPHPWFAYCGPCPGLTAKTPIAKAALAQSMGAERPDAATADDAHTVHFAFDSDVVADRDGSALRKTFPPDPTVQLAIHGHTDAIGDKPYNDDLAQRRARAVHDLLQSAGWSSAQLAVTAEGLCCYVASNATARGRAANRRVEVRRLRQRAVGDASRTRVAADAPVDLDP